MITSSDLKIYLSGGSSNTDPVASLGGAISSTEVVDNTLANLFPNVTSAQALAGITQYLCIFIKNTHATLTWTAPYTWISSNTPSTDSTINISVATETGSPVQVIGDITTAPTGQSFTAPTSFATGLSLGDLVPGACKAVWVQRVISPNAVAYSNDTATINYQGDTLA